jgi:hypothetical protein
MSFIQGMEMKHLLKEICTRLHSRHSYKQAKLYSKSGLEIEECDIQFIKEEDEYYIALDGENFNNYAILDDYELGGIIGEGGFGQVMLGTHRKT